MGADTDAGIGLAVAMGPGAWHHSLRGARPSLRALGGEGPLASRKSKARGGELGLGFESGWPAGGRGKRPVARHAAGWPHSSAPRPSGHGHAACRRADDRPGRGRDSRSSAPRHPHPHGMWPRSSRGGAGGPAKALERIPREGETGIAAAGGPGDRLRPPSTGHRDSFRGRGYPS